MKSITNLTVLVLWCACLMFVVGGELRAQSSTKDADEKPAASASEDKDESPDEAKEDAADDSENSQAKKEADADTDEKADEKSASDEKTAVKANGDAAAKKETAKKKRKTHKVEADQFRVEVELDGTFVAREMTEVPLRPDAWATFEIDKVVEHGSRVHEGEVLIEFDDEKLSEAIADLELDLHLSDLAIRGAEQELPRLEKTLQLALDEAERAAKQVNQDYERFKTLEQAFFEKMVEYTVKGSKFNLQDALEELQQLEKMYEADDLTEETEEIVLQRQRNTVDMAEFYVEDAEFYREGILKVTLPRMEIRMQNAVELAKLNVERAKMAMSLDMNRARYELEKRKSQQDRARERHAKLLGDQSLMEIKAPSEGIVYFGRCVDGQWVDMSSMINKLQPHSNASPNSVLMTIVKQRPLYVTATVGEKERPTVEAGQPAKVAPPPDDSDKLSAEITKVSVAPVSSSKFRVDLDLKEDDVPDWIVPGMSCEITVVTYDKEDAVVVPKDAVHTDEDDEEERYVWVVDPDDEDAKAERRTVKIGKRNDKHIEVLDGLKAGDVISLDEEDEQDDED